MKSDFIGRLWYRNGSVKVYFHEDRNLWVAQWQDAETDKKDGPRFSDQTALRAVNRVREFHSLWGQERLTGRRSFQILRKYPRHGARAAGRP